MSVDLLRGICGNRAVGGAGALLCLGVLGSEALAAAPAEWPSKPIRLIVSAATGSSIDIPARVVAEKLKERLGQPLVVDNRPQAGGIVSVEAAAKAPPDGYTLLWSFNG